MHDEQLPKWGPQMYQCLPTCLSLLTIKKGYRHQATSIWAFPLLRLFVLVNSPLIHMDAVAHAHESVLHTRCMHRDHG